MESLGKRIISILLIILATLSSSLPTTISLETDDIFPIEITNWGLPLYYSIYPTSDGNLLAVGVDLATQIDGETLQVSGENIRMNLYQLENDFTVYQSTIYTGKEWLYYYTLMPSGKRFIASTFQLLFLDADGTHGYRVGAGRDDYGKDLYKFCVYDYKGNLKWKYHPKNENLLGGINQYRYCAFIACGNVVFLDEDDMIALDSKTGEEVISAKIVHFSPFFHTLGMKKNARYAVVDTNVIDFRDKKVFTNQVKLRDFSANVYDDGFEICTNKDKEFTYKRFEGNGNLAEELKYAVATNEDRIQMQTICLSNHILCFIDRVKNTFHVYDFKRRKVLLDFELLPSYGSIKIVAHVIGKTLYIWADNILNRFDIESGKIIKSVDFLINDYSYTSYSLSNKFAVINNKKPDEILETIKLHGMSTQSNAVIKNDINRGVCTIPYKEGFLVSKNIDNLSTIKLYKNDNEETEFEKITIDGNIFWMSIIGGKICAWTSRKEQNNRIFVLWVVHDNKPELIKSWKIEGMLFNFIGDKNQFAFNVSLDKVVFIDAQNIYNIKESSFSLTQNGLYKSDPLYFKGICDNKLIFYNNFPLCFFNAEDGSIKKLKGDDFAGFTNNQEIVTVDYQYIYFYNKAYLIKREKFDLDYTYPFVSSNGNFVGYVFLRDRYGIKQQEFSQFEYPRHMFNIPREFWPVMSCCDNEAESKITFEGVAKSRKAIVCDTKFTDDMMPEIVVNEGIKGRIWKFELPMQDEYAFFLDDRNAEKMKEDRNILHLEGIGSYLIFVKSNAFLMPEDKVVESKYKTKFVGKQIADADTDGNIVSGFIIER